jgi:membrane protease YdiL (CAAX protease family)
MDSNPTSYPPPIPATVVAPAKPRVWPAFTAFAALLVLELIAAVVVVVGVTILQYGPKFSFDKIDTVVTSASGLLSSFVCTMAIAAGIALAGAWLSPQEWRERLRLRRVPLYASLLVMGTLGIMSVGMILSSCMELGWVPRSHALDVLDHMMRSLSPAGQVLAVLLLGLLPGLIEELLFRGYIQTRLVARWGAAWGIFWTALMFGISHLDLMQGLFAVAVGCILGFIAHRAGSIIPAMICHAANNLASGLLSVLAGDIHDKASNLAMLVCGLIILPLAILFLRRRLPPANPTATA